MNSTLTKVYAAIVAISLSAVVLASAISGGSNTGAVRYREFDIQSPETRATGSQGVTLSADDYATLGKYNPCIFIKCEGR